VARTILFFHIISDRPSKQPLMVRTFLKVNMEIGSYFLFLQEQIKNIIITCPLPCWCLRVQFSLVNWGDVLDQPSWPKGKTKEYVQNVETEEHTHLVVVRGAGRQYAHSVDKNSL
jgi:hypothetical protein